MTARKIVVAVLALAVSLTMGMYAQGGGAPRAAARAAAHERAAAADAAAGVRLVLRSPATS